MSQRKKKGGRTTPKGTRPNGRVTQRDPICRGRSTQRRLLPCKFSSRRRTRLRDLNGEPTSEWSAWQNYCCGCGRKEGDPPKQRNANDRKARL